MHELDISKFAPTKKKSPTATGEGWGDKISALLNKEIRFGHGQFPDKKKLQLYSDLGMLLSSGIDIRNSFEIIADSFPKKPDKMLINAIYQRIVGGVSISDAFRETGKFTPYEYYSIQIGEETGRLHTVLTDLGGYFKKKIEQKRKVMGAFMYPIIVVITAVLAVAFMLTFIVPMFEDIYKRFDKDLPALTQFIIRLSHHSTTMLLGLVLFILSLIIFRALASKTAWYRQFKDALLMNLPVFGHMIKKIQLSRFCLAMELLLSARLPLINALGLVKNMLVFYPLNTAISKIEAGILQGKTLHESMQQEAIFDKRMNSLVKVGEQVNQLDKTFSILKAQYQEEIEHQSGMISSILEPLMIVFIGIFVALILISMYLPIFKISTSFDF